MFCDHESQWLHPNNSSCVSLCLYSTKFWVKGQRLSFFKPICRMFCYWKQSNNINNSNRIKESLEGLVSRKAAWVHLMNFTITINFKIFLFWPSFFSYTAISPVCHQLRDLEVQVDLEDLVHLACLCLPLAFWSQRVRYQPRLADKHHTHPTNGQGGGWVKFYMLKSSCRTQ